MCARRRRLWAWLSWHLTDNKPYPLHPGLGVQCSRLLLKAGLRCHSQNSWLPKEASTWKPLHYAHDHRAFAYLTEQQAFLSSNVSPPKGCVVSFWQSADRYSFQNKQIKVYENSPLHKILFSHSVEFKWMIAFMIPAYLSVPGTTVEPNSDSSLFISINPLG